jgi:hypothetical protein
MAIPIARRLISGSSKSVGSKQQIFSYFQANGLPRFA